MPWSPLLRDLYRPAIHLSRPCFDLSTARFHLDRHLDRIVPEIKRQKKCIKTTLRPFQQLFVRHTDNHPFLSQLVNYSYQSSLINDHV